MLVTAAVVLANASFGLCHRVTEGVRQPLEAGYILGVPFGLGIWEILILAGILVLLFGAKGAPKMARRLGSSVKEMKDAVTEMDPRSILDPKDKPAETPPSQLEASKAVPVAAAPPVCRVAPVLPPSCLPNLSPPRPRPSSPRANRPRADGSRRLSHARAVHDEGGSTIREYLHSPAQSLAEATLEPGQSTMRHYHALSEEIYLLIGGAGTMEIDGETREVADGDAILIPPGRGTSYAQGRTGCGCSAAACRRTRTTTRISPRSEYRRPA